MVRWRLHNKTSLSYPPRHLSVGSYHGCAQGLAPAFKFLRQMAALSSRRGCSRSKSNFGEEVRALSHLYRVHRVAAVQAAGTHGSASKASLLGKSSTSLSVAEAPPDAQMVPLPAPAEQPVFDNM